LIYKITDPDKVHMKLTCNQMILHMAMQLLNLNQFEKSQNWFPV